jgi:hypothetical protein
MENEIEDYLGEINQLEQKIAEMSVLFVDEPGEILLTVTRGSNGVCLREGTYADNYGIETNHERFVFKFPMYSFWDLPSGQSIRGEGDGYVLTDENGNPIKSVDIDDLYQTCVDDLLDNYNGFRDRFDEFLSKFEEWLEVD